MRIAVTFSICIAPALALAQGSAADLDGLPSVGWPLGVPMTCLALTETLSRTLQDSVQKITQQCNAQNQQLKADGFASCSENECLDSVVTHARGYDHGAMRLRLGRSEWTNAYYATLSYSFPGQLGSTSNQPRLFCFNPADRAQELLREELETWDFQRFVEFCIKRNSPQE